MPELVASEILFESLADHAPVGVFVSNTAGSCIYANERLCELLGRPTADIHGAGWAHALHPEDAERVRAEWDEASSRGRDLHNEFRFTRPDGGVRWVEASTRAVHDCDEQLVGWVGCCVDVTARRTSERRYEALFEHASDAIFILSPSGEITAINHAAESLTGYARDELVGMNVFQLLAPEDSERARETFTRRLAGNTNELSSYEIIGKGGARVFVEVSGRLVEQDGKALGIETIARDTSERHAFIQKLRHEATHDELTGLPNRMLFHDRVELALARATRNGSRLALMVLDVDGFKRVNDSLGHATGDDLLVRLAPRLQRELRDGDSIARLGGDEFGFLFEDTREQTLESLAGRLLAAVEETTPQHHLQKLTACLGIVIPGPTDTTETALSNADSAMYSAKKAGPGRFEIYDETMRSRLLRDLTLTRALTSALENDEFDVYYQPIVSLTDGRILGMETLARWNHPELGQVDPAEFIPVAEKNGLIIPLGRHILDHAARNASLWRASYPDALPLGIFVNTSPHQLAQPDFVDLFLCTLGRHGLAPREIGIEITERAFIDHDEDMLFENLTRLNNLGIRMSLDDFGTGYASLTALKELPLDALKIDGSFIAEIRAATDGAPVTRASVTLGHALGLTVIAEGVETEVQATYLRRLGCDAAQGFYCGQPRPARQAGEALQAGYDKPGERARRATSQSVASCSAAERAGHRLPL